MNESTREAIHLDDNRVLHADGRVSCVHCSAELGHRDTDYLAQALRRERAPEASGPNIRVKAEVFVDQPMVLRQALCPNAMWCCKPKSCRRAMRFFARPASRRRENELGSIAPSAHGYNDSLATGVNMNSPLPSSRRVWPNAGYSRVPYWLYTDQEIFEREMTRIFRGPSWSFVGFAAELPESGSFKTTSIGNRSVIICRNRDGELRGFVNRCAHRGVKFCRERLGQTSRFTCPYHQWTYDLNGALKGVPFQGGVKGQGGMASDFDPKQHGLQQLRIAEHHGVVFASFDEHTEDFLDYLGEANRYYFERVFDGRDIRILGYTRQLIPGNWKLMFENIKDPYHASLLHVFLVTFGLFRADQESQVKMDPTGRHGLLISRRGSQTASEHTKDIANLRTDFKLRDPRLLDPVKEFKDSATVVMQTLWPNLIIQQQSNTLAMRQIQPRSPQEFELSWTFFGYADDDEAMTLRRLRQANLMSASGLVSGDDSEIIKLAQDGLTAYPDDEALLAMGGHDTQDEDHMVTEAAIRAFYKHYRAVMEI